MSDQKKKEFEEKFTSAIAASLQSRTAPEELRKRLMSKLEAEAKAEIPEGLDENEVTSFQERLSAAVHRSQDFAPEDELVLRTEARVSGELKRNVLSERSVSALIDGCEAPEALAEVPVPEEKLRFVSSLRNEIKRSTGELTAPPLLKKRIEKAIAAEGGQEQKVIPFPKPSQWKRGLSALTSLAAGFAVLFLTLFSSTEVALANSVRSDHQNCCRKAMKIQGDTPPTNVKAMLISKFGDVPVPPVDDSWNLRVSKMCVDDEGKSMVHFLYTRKDQAGELESMSFHFLPKESQKEDQLKLNDGDVEEIAAGEFPVIAWLEGDWVCTACSPDMDADSLTKEAVAKL